MNEHWTFHIEKNLAPELREQAVRLAARVPEGFSRRDCPKLWALADWLNTRPKAGEKTLRHRRRFYTVLSIFNLLLALFALGPALIAEEELFWVGCFGAICLGVGTAFLWRYHRRLLALFFLPAGFFYSVVGVYSMEMRPLLVLGAGLLAVAVASLLPRRKTSRKIKKVANTLFDARSSIPEGTTLEACFTDRGLLFRMGTEEAEMIPYSAFLCVIESRDLLLAAVDRSGFLLGKNEMSGSFEAFRDTVSAQVTWIDAETGHRSGPGGKKAAHQEKEML